MSDNNQSAKSALLPCGSFLATMSFTTNFAKVKLFTVDYSGYPAIQQDALTENGDDYYLYIVKEDSTVNKRKITRGKNIDGYSQVLDGLSDGEVVVVEGMLSLYEGAKVRDISGNVEFVEAEGEVK